MKKKIVSVVLAMCTCFSLVACGGSNSGAGCRFYAATGDSGLRRGRTCYAGWL